jgi:hypothetical protein
VGGLFYGNLEFDIDSILLSMSHNGFDVGPHINLFPLFDGTAHVTRPGIPPYVLTVPYMSGDFDPILIG